MKSVKAIRITDDAAVRLVNAIQEKTKEKTATGVAERLMFIGAAFDPVVKALFAPGPVDAKEQPEPEAVAR